MMSILSNWWEQLAADAATYSTAIRAVAYYRHSAQDRQANSIPLQRDQVRAWAAQQGILIIHEFSDPGRSGLTAEGRPGFNEMMEQWVKKRRDFQYVLCLDVSRWGRFQDLDLAAQYSAECQRHGKLVVYTTIGMPRPGDPLYPMFVQFERFRAAQYSRDLSDKVFRGAVRITEQGFLAGGKAPYGLRRLLLDETRQPVRTLQSGERKSIQNQRIRLAPGDQQEAEIVVRIFHEFTDLEYSLSRIAGGLNREQIPSPQGLRWSVTTVRRILRSEKYAGTMVYNKSTTRLATAHRKNPEDQWIRSTAAFDGLISYADFERTRDRIRATARRLSSTVLLERLTEVTQRFGNCHPALVRRPRRSPALRAYLRRFGSLSAAIQKLYAESRNAIRANVQQQIERLASDVRAYDDFLVVNGRFTVLIQPAVPIPLGVDFFWFFEPDQRVAIDLTLGVAVSPVSESDILGYLVFPRLLTNRQRLRVFGTSKTYLSLYGHSDLRLIEDLAGRNHHQ